MQIALERSVRAVCVEKDGSPALKNHRPARLVSNAVPAARGAFDPARGRGRTRSAVFFLETGARNNKLKIYEMVEHPAARALTGYLLVRGGVHQVP